MCENVQDHKTIVEREVAFHDDKALQIDVEKIVVEDYFESSTVPENRFIVSQMGDIAGRRILELGCGAGESSVYFAKKGASCVATDCSPGMIQVAKELARRNGVTIEAMVMDSMKISYPDNSFDFVYAANLLHHVQASSALKEMYRVVKPGGKVCFWDPLKHNPIINVYRKMARDVRSPDETPLNINIVKEVRRKFSTVAYDTFWICALWIFIRFYLIEKVDPNKEPYWKKIISEEKRLRSMYLRLERLDKFVKKFFFMKRFAWNIAIVATK